MTIWRAIYLDSINELDKSNFGCHWTKDEFYFSSMEFVYNNISKNKRKGKSLYLFKTKVDSGQINKKATIKSNKEYPSESECVLKTNLFLPKVDLVYPIEHTISFRANTGSRYDNWIKNK